MDKLVIKKYNNDLQKYCADESQIETIIKLIKQHNTAVDEYNGGQTTLIYLIANIKAQINNAMQVVKKEYFRYVLAGKRDENKGVYDSDYKDDE